MAGHDRRKAKTLSLAPKMCLGVKTGTISKLGPPHPTLSTVQGLGGSWLLLQFSRSKVQEYLAGLGR